MKKLKLDDLQVDSFATANNSSIRGTVAGNENSLDFCYTREYGMSCWCTGQETINGCGPNPIPTAEGPSCNYSCGGPECLSGQDITCDGQTNCAGDSNDYRMC